MTDGVGAPLFWRARLRAVADKKRGQVNEKADDKQLIYRPGSFEITYLELEARAPPKMDDGDWFCNKLSLIHI
eukprot:6447842-Alexandrium_andersonii.AAC.1